MKNVIFRSEDKRRQFRSRFDDGDNKIKDVVDL